MKSKMQMHDFYCVKCGKKNMLPVWRPLNKKRERGHLKKLFCLSCKEEVNHCEIVENDIGYTIEDFFLEYNEHNFNAEGERVLPFNVFKRGCRHYA